MSEEYLENDELILKTIRGASLDKQVIINLLNFDNSDMKFSERSSKLFEKQ